MGFEHNCTNLDNFDIVNNCYLGFEHNYTNLDNFDIEWLILSYKLKKYRAYNYKINEKPFWQIYFVMVSFVESQSIGTNWSFTSE